MRKRGEPYADQELWDAIRHLQENNGNQTLAAKAAGLPRPTFQGRIREAQTRGFLKKRPTYIETDSLIFPELPSSELAPEELIAQAAIRFERHQAARDARRWMEIKVKSNKPFAVAFVGDPHVDDSGCNWPLLRRDIKILAETPGMYAVNGGDLTNNWVGRLIRLYADQDVSKKQAWKMAAWLMRDAGIKWICHIIGNHDAWNDGPYLIKANAAPEVPVEDWQARFQLVCPNEQRIRIHVAHDFPGSSQWNPMHSAQKQMMLGEQADIYACADKHNWQMVQGENASRGFTFWLLRSRGYKYIDHHADIHGFASQKHGATVTAVINPMATENKRVNCFSELEEAADYLTYLRGK